MDACTRCPGFRERIFRRWTLIMINDESLIDIRWNLNIIWYLIYRSSIDWIDDSHSLEVEVFIGISSIIGRTEQWRSVSASNRVSAQVFGIKNFGGLWDENCVEHAIHLVSKLMIYHAIFNLDTKVFSRKLLCFLIVRNRAQVGIYCCTNKPVKRKLVFNSKNVYLAA